MLSPDDMSRLPGQMCNVPGACFVHPEARYRSPGERCADPGGVFGGPVQSSTEKLSGCDASDWCFGSRERSVSLRVMMPVISLGICSFRFTGVGFAGIDEFEISCRRGRAPRDHGSAALHRFRNSTWSSG